MRAQPEVFVPALFVPALPTLEPETLLHRGEIAEHHPFSSPTVRYFYFARNAIWRVVKMLGLEGGEVLVPAYHHGVEVEALIDAGAEVRFYSTCARWQIDLADVESRIGPRTKALYLIHFAGFPGPVREVKKLAERYGLPLIEDCALALFSADGERPLGVTGDVAIFSLYKVLAVPEGGALVVNTSELRSEADSSALTPPALSATLGATAALLLRNIAARGGWPGRSLRKLVIGAGKTALRAIHSRSGGQAPVPGKANGGQASGLPILTVTQHFDRGHVNLGISWITRQLLRMQVVNQIVERRRRNYLFLLEQLEDVSTPPVEGLPAGVVPLFYPLMVDDNRRVMERLVARGIEAVDFWREGHPSCDASEFPEAARLRTSTVEIPCHQDLTLPTLAQMVRAIRDVLAEEPGRRLFPCPPPYPAPAYFEDVARSAPCPSSSKRVARGSLDGDIPLHAPDAGDGSSPGSHRRQMNGCSAVTS